MPSSDEVAVCPSEMPLGSLRGGVAVTDNARGSGWLMWSRRNVHARFSGALYAGNAEHLVAVKFVSGQWFFDNNRSLEKFTPDSDDCLVAEVDFGRDTASVLRGDSSVINGIHAGFSSGDLIVTPNIWYGIRNRGEFGVIGSTLTAGSPASDPETPETPEPETPAPETPAPETPEPVGTSVCPSEMPLGELRNGVAARDNARGIGWLMWSSQNVHTRFNGQLHRGNAEHIVAVKAKSGKWYFDSNSSLIPFVPAADDCLIAKVDFGRDRARKLRRKNGEVQGIDAGYSRGNFRVRANVWGGFPERGEFGIKGTVIYK